MFESPFHLNLKFWISRIFKREFLSICLCAVGVFLSWYSYSRFRISQGSRSEVVAETVATDELGDLIVPVILVEVAGMVNHPGVYQVATTDRVGDAIEKAGGFKKEADQAYLSKDLNLAETVKDGQKIYIPFQGELEVIESSGSNDKTDFGAGTMISLISINSASSSELQELKGIGNARAEAIISERPYGSIKDLVEKGILSQPVFDEIKANLRL